MSRFYQYEGDLMDLPVNDNHLVFRWAEDDCKILFSVARQGNGASCHFASDKAGMRRLKEAINEFFAYLMWLFDWCTMVLAKTKSGGSASRVIVKCGFDALAIDSGFTAYVRCR